VDLLGGAAPRRGGSISSREDPAAAVRRQHRHDRQASASTATLPGVVIANDHDPHGSNQRVAVEGAGAASASGIARGDRCA
jgi:hypothetical protein